MWNHETAVDILSSPRRVWDAFSNPVRWHEWNAGVARIDLRGPFAAGTAFVMEMPDGTCIDSRLLDVVDDVGFTDETIVGAVRVVVRHRIETIDATRVRVTYATEVDGPDADAMGAMVTADFSQVLLALKARCEA